MKPLVLTLVLVASLALAVEFRVADFGAKADGAADDSAAFRAAFAAAAQSGDNATILLESKKYHVSSESADRRKPCFDFRAATNVTIQGVAGETEIISTSPWAAMFQVRDCTNIRLAGVVIDYDPLPFIQGAVTAVDTTNATFDFVTDEGFPAFAPPPPPSSQYEISVGRWGILIDRATRNFKSGSPSYIKVAEFTSLVNSKWRFKLGHRAEIKSFAVGDAFVMRGEGNNYGGHDVNFINCNGAALEDVTLYASPSLGVAIVGCDGKIVVRRVTATPRPGTRRLLSINADGIHCAQNRTGPLIEQCHLEGMTDDGVAMRDSVRFVERVISSTELRLNRASDIEPGDRIQVMNPHTGLVRGEAVVRSVQDRKIITFAPPIAGVLTSTNVLTGLVSLNNHLDADEVYNLSTCGAGYVIRSNYFGNFRGRGVVLRGINGLIADNIFENLSGPGISIANEPNWPEGPVPRDITIRGNRLHNVCLDGASRNMAALSVTCNGLKGGSPAAPDTTNHGIANVRIEGNLITDPPVTGIYLRACENVHLADNRILAGHRDLLRLTGISLAASIGVVIDNPAFTGRRMNFCGIEIQATVPPGEAGVKIIRPVSKGIPILDRRRKL